MYNLSIGILDRYDSTYKCQFQEYVTVLENLSRKFYYSIYSNTTNTKTYATGKKNIVYHTGCNQNVAISLILQWLLPALCVL